MKASIHPQFYDDVTVTCTGCGMSFVTGSTKKSITVHVCSKCHPFYTGEQRFIDTKGKVEKFKKKMIKANKERVKSSPSKSFPEKMIATKTTRFFVH
jgi:large subunit ribosomal protein L31